MIKSITDIKTQSGMDFDKMFGILKSFNVDQKYKELGVKLGDTWTQDAIWLVYFLALCEKIEQLEQNLYQLKGMVDTQPDFLGKVEG